MKRDTFSPLYDEALSSEHLYRREVTRTSQRTKEQEQQLLARVRRGESQARQELFTSCLLEYVQYWAFRYTRSYAWASRIDYMDVVQEGNLALVEMLDRALEKEEPMGYLLACAKYRMHHYCMRYVSLISTPSGGYAYEVESLDADDEDDEHERLLETLEAPPLQDEAPTETRYDALYAALDLLTDKQRVMLMRLYGLGMCPQEANHELARSLGLSSKNIPDLHTKAKKALGRILSTTQTNGKVYSLKQVDERLALDRNRTNRLLKRAHIDPCVRGFYRQEDIDTLAQTSLHAQAIAARKQRTA